MENKKTLRKVGTVQRTINEMNETAEQLTETINKIAKMEISEKESLKNEYGISIGTLITAHNILIQTAESLQKRLDNCEVEI